MLCKGKMKRTNAARAARNAIILVRPCAHTNTLAFLFFPAAPAAKKKKKTGCRLRISADRLWRVLSPDPMHHGAH